MGRRGGGRGGWNKEVLHPAQLVTDLIGVANIAHNLGAKIKKKKLSMEYSNTLA